MVNIKTLNKYEIGKILIPHKIFTLNYKKELDLLFEKLFSDNINYIIITNLFALSTIITFLFYIFIYPYIQLAFPAYFLPGFTRIITIFALWFVFNLLIYYFVLLFYLFMLDSKFKKIESDIERDLPEFIDNLVSNLKGGISLEKALLQSVRKEQKSLLKEITLINEKIMMGKSVSEALSEFRKRFNSAIINRTFFLITEGLKGGGNLANPLERISENLKRIYNLDEEIKSNSSGFSVIITFITIIISPLLFALAITLLSFISNLFDLLSQSPGSFLSVVAVPIEFSEYLRIFSYGMLVLVTFFSSLIVAQLKNERLYTVVKYLPIYILFSVILYQIFSSLLLGFFGTILG